MRALTAALVITLWGVLPSVAQSDLIDDATAALVRVGCLVTANDVPRLKLRTAVRCAQRELGLAPDGMLTPEFARRIIAMRPNSAADQNQMITTMAPGAVNAPDPETIPPTEQPVQIRSLRARDFTTIDGPGGSFEVPALGLRLQPSSRMDGTRPFDVSLVVAIQEFGPAWAMNSERTIPGALLAGDRAAIERAIQRELSRVGERGLRDGFSVPLSFAEPYRNHKDEPKVQVLPIRIQALRPVMARAGWSEIPMLATQIARQAPDLAQRQARLDDAVATYQARLAQEPCAVSNMDALAVEMQLDLLALATGSEFAPVLPFRLRDTACEISKNGAYALPDLIRLAALRQGTCETLVDPEYSTDLVRLAQSLQTEVPPDQYIQWASIGVFDLRDPERRNLTSEQGRARAACVYDYLEAALLAD